MRISVELNESDLLARMRNFEDHLVERKTVKDEKDWKKTAVAFANSVPVRDSRYRPHIWKFYLIAS